MRLRFDYDSKVSIRESDLRGYCAELSIGKDSGTRFTVDMSLEEARELSRNLISVTEEVLNRSIDELLPTGKGNDRIEVLSLRAYGVLRTKAKVQKIGELVTKSEADMIKTGIGRQSLSEITAAMAKIGLSFKKEARMEGSIEEAELSVRSYNFLKNANIRNLGEMALMTEGEFLGLKNASRKSLNEIKELMAGMGVSFKVDGLYVAGIRS